MPLHHVPSPISFDQKRKTRPTIGRHGVGGTATRVSPARLKVKEDLETGAARARARVNSPPRRAIPPGPEARAHAWSLPCDHRSRNERQDARANPQARHCLPRASRPRTRRLGPLDGRHCLPPAPAPPGSCRVPGERPGGRSGGQSPAAAAGPAARAAARRRQVIEAGRCRRPAPPPACMQAGPAPPACPWRASRQLGSPAGRSQGAVAGVGCWRGPGAGCSGGCGPGQQGVVGGVGTPNTHPACGP